MSLKEALLIIYQDEMQIMNKGTWLVKSHRMLKICPANCNLNSAKSASLAPTGTIHTD